MIKRIGIVLGLCALVIAGCKEPHRQPDPGPALTRHDAESPLARHTEEFTQKVYRVTDRVSVAVGFGLANAIMIEGEDGIIIVDAMETVREGETVLAEFRKLTDKPVKAIVYTHNHVDHVMGARAFAGEESPMVIAHEHTDEKVSRIACKMRPIVGTRSLRMFGNHLAEEDVVNAGIGPFLGDMNGADLGYLRPTVTVSGKREMDISGVKLVFLHVPGETDDQLLVWLPEEKMLLPGDNFYRSFPNLYTIRGTTFRSLEQWYRSIDAMRDLGADYLVPSHSRPISGQENVARVLTDYRDAIQYVHDQGIRGINAGMTPDEIAQYVRLPEHLATSPYLQEFYGKVTWSLRSLFAGNLGWFDGDAATLQPQNRRDKAEMLADLAGGYAPLAARTRGYLEAGRHQAALELTGHLLRLRPEDDDVKALRIQALIALGQAEQNANARHYYLTEAQEIQEGSVVKSRVQLTPDAVRTFTLTSFMDALPVFFDAKKAGDLEKRLEIRFPAENAVWGIHIRRGVAEVRPVPVENPEIVVIADGQAWKEMIIGIRGPVKTLLGFDYEKGNSVSFGKIMKLFSPPDQKLAYAPMAR